ncbi:MAG: membrane dipeptidase [Firmicutes bacterium]|jgi:membrane dipeptidase|nr:dipeptidase [Bacillota bacterium]NLL88656.1 membrane dipeptidase [Bacillota bacterium]
MYIFDAHVDTLAILAETGVCDLGTLAGAHVTLPKMQRAGIGAQIFAICVPRKYVPGMALHIALKMVDIFWRNMDRYSAQLKPALSKKDFQLQVQGQQPIRCLLSIEGGEPLAGSLANLRILFRLGVRAMTLTWNHRNALGDGVAEGERASGLTEFGYEVVAEMNRLGMIVDVSHLAEPSFWEVLEVSRKPVIASHSNAYALCGHRRNLTDQQIRAIADRGGVIGVNFCPRFVVENPNNCTIEQVVDHIIYLYQTGGSDAVALGSDFDGIASTPTGLEDVEKIPSLIPALEKRGLSTAVIEKIMGLNLLRVAGETLPEESS